MSVAVLTMIALVIAGDGAVLPPPRAPVPVAHQRREAGRLGRRLRGAGDQRVERVPGRELRVAGPAAVVVGADLRLGAGDVRAGGDDVRLDPPVVGRPAAGEVDDVLGAVGAGVGDPAAVRAGDGRTFSEAPTVITFFAVPGAPIVFPPEPALPAENTLVICWLPAVAGCASRTRASNSASRRCRRRRRWRPRSCSRPARPGRTRRARAVKDAGTSKSPAQLKIFVAPSSRRGAIPSP